MQKLVFLPAIILTALSLTGCQTTKYYKKGPSFDSVMRATKTIAVMPVDVTVFELSAGGVPEEIDRWSISAREMIRNAIKDQLSDNYQYEIKFIDESWLKNNYKDLWKDYSSLYEAVASAGFLHGFEIGANSFKTKKDNFDYTLGNQTSALANIVGADALLFTYGFDYETTAGRKAVVFLYAMAGVNVQLTATGLNMGLVDGTTGDLLWLKGLPFGAVYSFQNKNHIDTMMEWMMRGFIDNENN